MTVISDIDEFGINTNLKVRYEREQIYVSVHGSALYTLMYTYQYQLQTYSGTILVAVNPYHQLNIYEMVRLTSCAQSSHTFEAVALHACMHAL